MIKTEDRKLDVDKGHISSNEERPVTYTSVGVLASSSASSIKACSTTSTTSVMDQYYLHAGETVGLVQRNNPLSSTEIVGELRSRLDFEEGSGPVNILALCTLDGMCIVPANYNTIYLHSLQVLFVSLRMKRKSGSIKLTTTFSRYQS